MMGQNENFNNLVNLEKNFAKQRASETVTTKK